MTVKLTPYLCESTGETIQIFPISQVSLGLKVRREIPQPKPPLVEVELLGKRVVERNHADPDYIESIKVWENLLQLEVTDRMIKRLAAKQKLTEAQKKEVAELREILSDEQLPESDQLVWLTEIAIGNDQDLRDILNAVSGLKDPSREGVEAAKQNFRR